MRVSIGLLLLTTACGGSPAPDAERPAAPVVVPAPAPSDDDDVAASDTPAPEARRETLPPSEAEGESGDNGFEPIDGGFAFKFSGSVRWSSADGGSVSFSFGNDGGAP